MVELKSIDDCVTPIKQQPHQIKRKNTFVTCHEFAISEDGTKIRVRLYHNVKGGYKNCPHHI